MGKKSKRSRKKKEVVRVGRSTAAAVVASAKDYSGNTNNRKEKDENENDKSNDATGSAGGGGGFICRGSNYYFHTELNPDNEGHGSLYVSSLGAGGKSNDNGNSKSDTETLLSPARPLGPHHTKDELLLVARNVPRGQFESVLDAMMTLIDNHNKNHPTCLSYASCFRHGDTAHVNGLYFLLREILDEDEDDGDQNQNCNHKNEWKKRLLPEDPSASLMLELIPRFIDHSSDSLYQYPTYDDRYGSRRWGGRPRAPEGKEEMVDEIFQIWNNQDNHYAVYFFSDGGDDDDSWKKNNPFGSKAVDIAVSLRHIHDDRNNTYEKNQPKRVVHWHEGLKRVQANYVRENHLYFSELAKVLCRKKEICAYCGLMEPGEQLRVCARCKQTWYCSAECQKAHWPLHKKKQQPGECQDLANLRKRKGVSKLGVVKVLFPAANK